LLFQKLTQIQTTSRKRSKAVLYGFGVFDASLLFLFVVLLLSLFRSTGFELTCLDLPHRP